MAFLWRMSRRQTRLNYLCSQFKRTYLHLSSPCFSAHNILPTTSNHYRLNEGFSNVRFFAAPIQHRKKEETKTQKGPRMNEQIKTHMVRLVVDEGHEIVPLHVAIERAKRLNHDLVEVDRNAKPIVCKIMDYHRERYQKQVKEKERSKSKAESTVRKGPSKEVRFSPKIEQKDLQMKADMAKRLMERGYRVKCMVLGSEEGLGELINRLHALIEDVAYVESGPMVEKSQAYIVVRHIKFGPSKKGGKGAAKSADAASPGCQKATRSQSTGGPSSPIQHPADLDLTASEDSGSENDYDESFPGGSDSLSTAPPEQDKMNSWSLSDANGAGKNVFDFIDDLENADTSSDQKKKSLLESAPPNFMGPGANTSENRYSRQGSTRRGPPGSEQYVLPGPDPKSLKVPPRREIPKQNPSTSDCIPSSTSYGIFSNPDSSMGNANR